MMRIAVAVSALLAIGMIALAVRVATRPDLPPPACLPWADQRDPTCRTIAEIVAGKTDILVILHEREGGGWTLLDGQGVSGRMPVAWPKEQALKADPSIAPALTITCGQRAVRKARGEPWSIE